MNLMLQLLSRIVSAPEWCQEIERKPVRWHPAETVYSGRKASSCWRERTGLKLRENVDEDWKNQWQKHRYQDIAVIKEVSFHSICVGVTWGLNWPWDSCQMPVPVVLTLKSELPRQRIGATTEEGLGRHGSSLINLCFPSLQFHEAASGNL